MLIYNALIEEHNIISKFNNSIRKACLLILDKGEVNIKDFKMMIKFIRDFVDKYHHGKEEKILFKEMLKSLPDISKKLITHGMLVEHDLGRLYIFELENALNRYEKYNNNENILDIISNAISYTELLKRHISKENDALFPFAKKNLVCDMSEETNKFEDEQKENSEEFMKIFDFITTKYS